MEPLEQLREKIQGFPGYDGHLERRRSDEYVRSYLGEALTDMAARVALEPPVQSCVDALVLHVAFADPRAFNAHDGAGDTDGAVAAADAATIDLADRASAIDAASAASYVVDVTAAIDRRDEALRAAALKLP